MKNYIRILAVVTITLFTSCSKDFLERPPESAIIPEDYLKEESQLAAYSIEMYGLLPTHGNWSFGTFGIDTNTDNQASMSYNNMYVPGQYRVPQTGGDWNFDNIYRINYFLETVVPRYENNEITGSESGIEHYIGEMYFFRAFEYFNKLRSIGDTPIVETTLPDDKETLTAASTRDPRSEVARFIISDLDKAIELMMASSPDGGKNRLNKACAQLLKSRVALYEGTWLKYFSNTAFVPNGPGWPGAEKDYNQGYTFQAGSIDAEIDWLLGESMDAAKQVADQYSLTTNNGVLQQSDADGTNPYFNMFSDTNMSGYDEVLLWRDYDRGLGITHNVPVYAQLGNNGVGLTKGMVDSFLMANGLPIYAAGSGYAGDDYIADVRENRDGRLWLFLKQPGQVNIIYESSEGDHGTPIEPVPDITNSSVEQGYSTGYTIRKGLNYDQAQTGNGQGSTGAIVFRATEAYLNYMEACYERNGALDGSATQYWREIRDRAQVNNDFQATIAATDMQEEAKGDWGAYSAGQLIEPTLYNIRRERRDELMAEGLRMMDLKRWRAMDQLVQTPYHIEGFKLWGPMQDWYADGQLTYGTSSSNVSAPSRSDYLRPYEKTGNELVYDGYRWMMAHYLSPIAIQHFLITTENNDVEGSPIYQNPGWPTTANEGATF
ncbi:RagB/SusD family nutrient uptake outer membrane protein [Robertkochia solimangrovi]|uniref:RagB/SusD family nutrient uptake outer membrane protein n=1 Tax=Robertkochia solimangrovi TaxID=2213046 RepID=UPI00117C6075|nr:RagB/SusD family nutrient uptake outer membrane protein [Robertkochia solimangrovi]TRZ44326.1 RagB/SusD family nutrient uptake outer membrane protein [Robertkochia solimangrovi]